MGKNAVTLATIKAVATNVTNSHFIFLPNAHSQTHTHTEPHS